MYRSVLLFADGARVADIAELARDPRIDGFTTNPTLMRKVGVTNYEAFGRAAVNVSKGKPISFEVFADDLDTMKEQALKISSWGDNVYVKLPVTNTKGEFVGPIISLLADRGVKLNITAVFTDEQVADIVERLPYGAPAIVSVFAGRIADAGVDPVDMVKRCIRRAHHLSKTKVLWASPRQVYDAVLADRAGCDIITMTRDHLDKLGAIGKDLNQFSLDTVKMFHRDALAAGYTLA